MMYGSLHNRIDERAKQAAPEVGMGCTVLMYSDRHAATIIEVAGNVISIQEDRATRTDKLGMSDCQSYSYTADKDARIQKFSKRKNGRWVAVGEPMHNGTALKIGYRDSYHDYSF